MKHSLKVLLAGALLVASFGLAHAEGASADTHAVLLDGRGNPVLTKDGVCVRTSGDAGIDACAPKEPPAPPLPAPVVREDRTIYFGFNKASLTPEGKKVLDSLFTTIKLRGPVKAVHVAGYADRMGNAAYNEKLSKKRADAVRTYLVTKGVLQAKVVETRWFGDSIAAANCPKTMKHKEKIACMQPDRRVEVEVEFASAIPMPAPVAAPAPTKSKHMIHHHHKAKPAAKAEKAK
jgi:OOP family OmpA-OmpF porin